MRKKISVIGAGNVGATTALYLAQQELGDVVLVDIVDGVPQGKALDMAETGPVQYFDSNLTGSSDFSVIKDSDIVITTAGFPRKPGMTREDLLQKNAQIIKSVADNIKTYAPNSIVIVITNPLDVMTYLMYKLTGFEKNRVIGQAGILDSARFRAFISMELNVSVEDIQTMVLGGHGDTMVPLPDYTTVAGIPLKQLMSEEKIQALCERTRKGGGEIVALLKTGSAYYAPAAAATQMAEAILKDKKRILPCSALCNGEFGLEDVYIGVPVVLGAAGREKVIDIKLNEDDKASLLKSANFYKEQIKLALKLIGLE